MCRFLQKQSPCRGAKQHSAIVQAKLLKNGFGISYPRLVLFIAFLRMGELEELDLLD